MDLISIIIPAYNAEKTIKKCIKSVLSQQEVNLEIVLVDDGSIDKTGLICDELAQFDSRLHVIHVSNGGSVLARKIGLEAAKGQYIGFVDSDDYVEPDMYLKLYRSIKENESDIAQAGAYFERGNNISEEYRCTKRTIMLSSNRDIFISNNFICIHDADVWVSNTIWSKLFKKNVIYAPFMNLNNEQQYGEDLLCMCECLCNCNSISFIPDMTYHYVINQGSLSHGYDTQIVINEAKLYSEMMRIFEKNKILTEILAKAVNEHLNNNVSYIVKQIVEIKKKREVKYEYVDIESLRKKRVCIYGAGKVGIDYYKQLSVYEDINVVAIIDSFPDKYSYSFVTIHNREILYEKEYDIIVIAVKNESISNEIRAMLIKEGIEKDIIVWSVPGEI